MAVKNIIKKVEQEAGEQDQIQNLITSISSSYEIVDENFTAEIGKNYAVDTTSGVVSVTLPTNPQAGEIVGFADAKGTWGTNAITILRNGKNIEGSQINFSNNASGTFFVVLFIDSATGWRVLTSGTKPLNLVPPTVSGTYDFSSTNGTWTGSPTSFSYQWQMSINGTSGWTNINGATSSSYLAVEADEGKYVRIGVVAANSNGPSVVTYSAASAAINLPDFPTTGLLAFYKLDNVNDASGNGKTLTNNNTVTFSAGKIGNAANVDSGKYLSISSLSIPWQTAASLSGWIKTTNNTPQLSLFFSYNVGFGIGIESNSILTVYDYLGGEVYSTATISANTWHHIVVTTSGNVLKIYLDGVLVGTLTNILQNISGLAINDSSYPFTGQADAVGVWNRELTTQEIAQLYNNGNGLEPI